MNGTLEIRLKYYITIRLPFKRWITKRVRRRQTCISIEYKHNNQAPRKKRGTRDQI